MSQLSSVFRREFWSYFRTPIAYVFIVAFNLAAVINTFLLAGLLDSNRADLQPFFSLLPWLLLVVVPGISMRSWAEEKSAGTLELTLVLPVRLWTHILGKFLAAWAVISISIALTFPLVLTIVYLGQPDAGALICAYLGSFLLAGALLAVSTLCSVVSRSQVISFVLSLLVNLVLLILGWGVFTDILVTVLPLRLVDAIGYLGVLTHFDALGRGVIPLQDVIYFLTLIVTTLLLSFLLLTQQRASSAGKRFETFVRQSTLRQLLAVGGSSLLLIALSALVPLRWDLTANRSYSISPPSLAIAEGLDRDLSVTLYFSQSLREVPPYIKLYGKRVADVLRQYAQHAHGHMQLTFVDPRPDSKEEDEAIHAGLKGMKLREGTFYFGISIKSGEQQAAVPYLDPNREDLLEYEITKAIVGSHTSKKPVLGVLSSLKVSQANPDGSRQRWALLEQLETSFKVEELTVLENKVPESIDVLLLIHPKDWSHATLLAIDQFVMRGGKVLMAVDAFSRIELVQKYGKPIIEAGGEMVQTHSQPHELFKAWGIAFDVTKVIGDPNRATTINIYGQSTLYPLFIKLGAQDFGSSPIMKNLQEILLAEPGALALAPDSPLTMEPLLQTSEESGTSESFVLSFEDTKKTISIFKPSHERRVLAALFRGTFTSAFPNAQGSLKSSQAPASIIVVADADFLEDRHATRTQNMGDKISRVPKNDNINFILNSLDYLAGTGSLLAIRSSGVLARPFTVLRDLQKDTEERWREEEKELLAKVHAAQQQLGALYSRDSQANRLELNPDELKIIKKLRQEEREMDSKYRKVRRNLREEVQGLNHRLIAYNVLAAPLLVLAFGLGFFTLRFRRSQQRLHLQRVYFAVPALLALTGLVLGFAQLEKRSMRLQAAPVFETLFDMEKLASVQRVILTERGQTATIIKGSDGMWRLQEAGMQLVNSDRLARLLYDFSEAKIVRRINGSRGNAESLGLNQGKSIAFEGAQRFKLTVGHEQPHGGYIVQQEGRDGTFLIDQLLHTNTSAAFWLMTPPPSN